MQLSMIASAAAARGMSVNDRQCARQHRCDGSSQEATSEVCPGQAVDEGLGKLCWVEISDLSLHLQQERSEISC